jgi:hypothetical protein
MYKRCPPTSRMECRITKAFLPFCPLSTLFSPYKTLSPQEFQSLQDLRCSDSIWISSTKTREQHFPCFTPSTLPRGQRYHLFSIFASFPSSVLRSKISSPICLVLFRSHKAYQIRSFLRSCVENTLLLTSPLALSKTRFRAPRRKLPPHAEAVFLCKANQQQFPSAGTMCVHNGHR